MLEVPVRWSHSDDSKVSYLRDSVDMFLDLVRIRLNDIKGRYEDEVVVVEVEQSAPVEKVSKRQ